MPITTEKLQHFYDLERKIGELAIADIGSQECLDAVEQFIAKADAEPELADMEFDWDFFSEGSYSGEPRKWSRIIEADRELLYRLRR